MIKLPFWGNLTWEEGEEYRQLMSLIGPWAGWCSLSKTKKAITPAPQQPTSMQFHRYEWLAMKGWEMLQRCPWNGEYCECQPKKLAFAFKVNGKIPDRCNREI